MPWSKLRSTTGTAAGDDAGAVVVVVMDGIHLLARTLYEFHDDKMRQQDVQQRRKKLQEAQAFREKASEDIPAAAAANTQSFSWFSVGNLKEFVQRRISEGLLQQIVDKLHIHIRDLHIRLEDTETDPVHPFACGIVMESMHVQHWEENGSDTLVSNSQRSTLTNDSPLVGSEDDHNELFPEDSERSAESDAKARDTIRKVAQVNHYAMYWNALGYEEGLPLEHSVLHQLPSLNTPQLLVAALDRGIARRANALWSSPGGRLVVPTHTYLLMPLDCSLQAILKMDPTGNSKIPSTDITFLVEAVNVQMRDFQVHQMSRLIHTMKEHNFTKPYRRFRPQVSVAENPRVWWKYAFRVVSYELKGSRLRWSWGRLRQRYAGRHRYCELYERKLKYDFYMSHKQENNHGSLSAFVESSFDTTPDDGAGPSIQSETNSIASSESQLVSEQRQTQNRQSQSQQSSPSSDDTPRPLTELEAQELQDLEDGVTGDMLVSDILLYRLLVHNQLGNDYQVQQERAQEMNASSSSWLFGNSLVQNAIQDDIECQQEVKRLMAYLEHTSKVEESNESTQQRRNVPILTVQFQWNQGCLAFFSPLPSTAQEPSLLRRLHERFLDLTFDKLTLGLTLMGDLETAKLYVTLKNYTITEIRSNQDRQKFDILSRVESDITTPGTPPPELKNDKDNGQQQQFIDPLLGSPFKTAPARPQEDASSPQQPPLFYLEIGINPPQQEGCRVSVKGKLEQAEAILSPDCQWIGRLKGFLKHSTGSKGRKLEDYWKGLNYASINAWASRRLGLRAKAQTAMESHKSINLDIHIRCPLIRISGTGDKKVFIDLGSAHLKTVKLAGVASTKLNQTLGAVIPRDSERSKARTTSSDGTGSRRIPALHGRASKETKSGDLPLFDESDRSFGRGGLSSSPAGESYLAGPTPSVSFDNQSIGKMSRRGGSRKRDRLWGFAEESFRSVDGTAFLDADRTHGGDTRPKRQEDHIHSSFFYDVYQLNIRTGDAVVSEGIDAFQESKESEEHPLLAGSYVQISIHKSIIPADHTLCRFRIDCVIGDISASLSKTNILQLSNILETWKALLANPNGEISHVHKFSEARRYYTRDHLSFSSSLPDPRELRGPEEELQSNYSVDNGSQVDEEEFFDAMENDENSENLLWLEDNWIADAESVLDAEQLSAAPRHRKPKTAMSDVSSLSDRSIKRRRPKEAGAYLNEENLARLEEGMGEEDSLDGSGIDSDSFHSALSPNRVGSLLEELDQNIKEARESLSVLKSKIDEISLSSKQQVSSGPESSRNRRMLMKSMKIEQERLRAQLNEMIATRDDLAAQMALLEDTSEDPSRPATVGAASFDAPARRASLLLTTKMSCDKSFDVNALQHSLTRNLNPQLIQCTVILNKVKISLKSTPGSGQITVPLTVELCVSQTAMALRHSVNETKAYLSIEHVSLGCGRASDSQAAPRFLLLAGTQYDLAGRLLPSHFPQYISTVSMEDKFLKGTIELRHKRATGNSVSAPEILRLRVGFGDLEITPSPSLIKSLFSYGLEIKRELQRKKDRSGFYHAKKKEKRPRKIPSYLDMSVRLASVRLVLEHEDNVVGALTLTEVAARFAQSSTDVAYKSRRQFDLLCTNVQILHIEDLHLGKGSEVLGRRDPYLPVIQLRARSQLVPQAESSGWVAGVTTASQPKNGINEEEEKVWNAHVGVKVNSLSIVASPRALLQLRQATRNLSSIPKSLEATEELAENKHSTTAESTPVEDDAAIIDSKPIHPILWRADLIVRKTSVTFLSQETQDWDPRYGSRNMLLLTWSLFASLEQSIRKRDAVSLQLALTDISLVRSLDESHLLEPLDMLLKGQIYVRKAQGRPTDQHITLAVDSPWNEIAAIMHRHGWDISSSETTVDASDSLALLVTTAKINLTAPLVAFLAEIVKSLTTKDSSSGTANNQVAGKRIKEFQKQRPDEPRSLSFRATIRSIDLLLCREKAGRPGEPTTSFAIRGMQMSLEKNSHSMTLNTVISDALAFDLSSRPGVCVLARKGYQQMESDSTNNRDFLVLDINVARGPSRPTYASLNLHFGKIKCLILPPFIHGLLTFQKDVKSLLSKEETNAREKDGGRKKGGSGIFRNQLDLTFSFAVEEFECILSTREILSYIREHNKTPINVVSFRWKSDGKAVLVVSGLGGVPELVNKLKAPETFQGLEEENIFKELIGQYSTQMNPKASKILGSRMLLSVYGFQVLRTNIEPLARQQKDTSPYFFKVCPPTAGEQLITNSFDFNLLYNAFGAKLRLLSEMHSSGSRDNFEFAHAVRLEAQLVDVLVYIAQSAGGIHDALRVTVTPILEMFKKKGGERESSVEGEEAKEETSVRIEEGTFIDAIKRAATIFSIKAEGIRVTCVPGGATRLTESPIINFSLLDFALGLAVCGVPSEARLLADTDLESLVDKNAVVSGFRELHGMLGAWLNCKLSASYHNRRLVAWEPFIEPWKLEVKFGADLVKLLKLPPLSIPVYRDWNADIQKAENPFASLFNDMAKPESTGERLRDFRNLLRSTFRSRSVGNEQEAGLVPAKPFPFENDFGYLMLVSASNALVAIALHPPLLSSTESILGFKQQLSSYLPTRNSMKWLSCFGYPFARSGDNLSSSSRPSFACSISDTKPLNINLTGALIENVLGYLRQEKSRTVAPHWIKNESGLTIRFREVLDEARLERGEKASKVTLSNGSEVPLSLKRTLSQSCDPHRAYILIELGSFEDTVGRIEHQDLDIQKGSLSSMFFYKVVAKVPVDTVGVHRYPLDRNVDLKSTSRKLGSDSRPLGWIIVRVALHGGIKLVSIESPLALKNNTDADLLCEVRAHDRLSLLWRHLVPKSYGKESVPSMSFVPVDIVPFLHDRSHELSVEALPRMTSFHHESELSSSGGRNSITVKAPPPFSRTSLSRGLIEESHLMFKTWSPSGIVGTPTVSTEHVHLNVCSLRVGTFDSSQLGNPSESIPEQRMLFFRSPLAVRNHLAFPIVVQVRVKRDDERGGQTLIGDSHHDEMGWEDLGVLECGQTVSWTGATPQHDVEMRVKFVAKDPETSRRFVSWSSIASIPPTGAGLKAGEKTYDSRALGPLSKMRILDTSGILLGLSIAVGGDAKGLETGSEDSIKSLSTKLSPASRVVSIYVPFWVVDGTGQDLEFSSKSLVAGQFDARDDFLQNGDSVGTSPGLTMGLAELLEDAKLSHLPSRSSFSILLIGDERSRKLMVRQRLRREYTGKDVVAPWSDTIPLKAPDNKHFDVTVMPPSKDFKYWTEQNGTLEPYALRSRVVSAPEKFGGHLGTKIVHVVCRYAIVNELGREIEIIAEHSRGAPVLIRADGKPKPFHFDDSGPIQLRPKEFGWVWSGRFYIRSDRREIALRVRHKLKGHTIIVNAEVHAKQKSGTCIIVLRAASHPPFRFENHTMYPLEFVQTYLATNENDIIYNREVASSETILLPYHHADFAWDEPEHRRKSVKFEVADFGNRVNQPILGRFNLDRIAPGTELKMESRLFVGQVVADGPTRVLRITEASMPRLRLGATNEVKFQNREEGVRFTFTINIKLSHGLGISIVDWSPQELLFLRIDDIDISHRMEADKQLVDASIGRVSIDNQLWVSPYPVLLEMGSRKISATLAHIRRKSRRPKAISLSFSRPLISTNLYGDLTLLERFELSTDPIKIHVDGNLAGSLKRMMQQAIDMAFESGDSSGFSRNKILRKILDIPENDETKRKVKLGPADIYSSGDAVTTAAIAAKSRSSRDPMASGVNPQSSEADTSTLSKAMRKCYIEKLRISTTKLEISWSGSLPFLSLPRLLPLSLTFEGFPLTLRQYSSSHAYGTVADHLQALKAHYLSIWRALDTMLGLTFKPTFLINAIIYTWSESFASILELISRRLSTSKERLLLKMRETKPQPIYDDGLALTHQETAVSWHWKLVGPFLRLFASILHGTETISGFGSALFRYDPTKYGGMRRQKTGLVRTRNPRLFANVDGRDLLVEYVEAENAGKALLSRIRMGMHLGEGYIYHTEGLYQKTHGTFSKSKKKGMLILMVTFERLVLVKGDLNADFCSVTWEVTFDNLIHVEVSESEDPGFELVTVWYLANALQEVRKGEDHLVMSRHYAKTLVGDPDCGLDNLRSMNVYVPHGNVEALISKVQRAKKLL